MILGLLIAAGTAFAATASLKLTGPSGTLKQNQVWTATAYGTATKKATTLFAYEGGYVGSSHAAINCYSTAAAEHAAYGVSVLLGVYHVQGKFSKSWKRVASNPGPRSFCAYLANKSGSDTYAAASLHWTNSST